MQHVFHNIDWKHRTLGRISTYQANSILAQKYDLAENLPSVSLDANSNFERKNKRSYKGSTLVLSSFCLKSGSAKRLKHTALENREECINSPKRGYILGSQTRNIGFLPGVDSTNLSQNQILDQITAAYLLPLPFSPVEINFISVEIRRTQGIMKKTWKGFHFHRCWSSYIHESTWCGVRIGK